MLQHKKAMEWDVQEAVCKRLQSNPDDEQITATEKASSDSDSDLDPLEPHLNENKEVSERALRKTQSELKCAKLLQTYVYVHY